MITVSLLLAGSWALAVVLAVRPCREQGAAMHALIAAGVPIAGLVTYQHGPWLGLAVFSLGIAELRWQLRHGPDAAE